MNKESTIKLTDSLVQRVKELQGQEGNPHLMLRISINGGGCSGFQYEFSFESKATDADHIYEKDSAKLVIDDISLQYLEGSTIDYKKDFGGSYFHIDNPNASSSCGCGTSFSV